MIMDGRTIDFGEHARREGIEKGGWVVKFYMRARKIGVKRRGDNYLLQAYKEYRGLIKGLTHSEIGDLDRGLVSLASDMGVKNPNDMIDTLKGSMNEVRISRDTKTLEELREATKVEGEEEDKGTEEEIEKLKKLRKNVTDEEVKEHLGNFFQD